MTKLILKDGTEHDCYFEGSPWPGEINFTLLYTDLMTSMLLLSDKSKTEDMVIKTDTTEREYHGYTVVQALVLMGQNVRCVMRQEVIA